MSSGKRTYTKCVGTLLCEELSELGSGKAEGWLVDERNNIICALVADAIALANRSVVLITGWVNIDDERYNGSTRVKIRPELSHIEGEYISAVAWLVFDDVKMIAIGTSLGYFMIYSLDGHLVLRQMVYPGKVLMLRIRGNKSIMVPHGIHSEDITVVFSGIVARFDGSDIRNYLEETIHRTGSGFWDEKTGNDDQSSMISQKKLPYQLWSVNKYGKCADAAVAGIMPPPLMEVQSNQRHYCAITVGEDSVISAYRLSEDRSRSLVGSIISKVVPATLSTITSLSKMLWRSEPSPPRKTPVQSQPFAKVSPITCLKDHPRKGEKLALSPGGTLAAITDSLGRILLLDTQALVVVRLWKGYRDASCLFMELLVKNQNTAGSSFYTPPKSDYSLCLAIHAPRKEIIEVWQMRIGPRVMTVPCPKGSVMLQPVYRFEMSTNSYIPLEVFILNGDSGQISVLNRILT